MAVPFARSIRSLNADRFRFALLGLVLAMLLLGAWGGWFFFARIALFETSQEAWMVDGELVVANFPKDKLKRIVRGQRARFQPDGVALDSGGIAAVVSEVTRDPSAPGEVILVVLNDRRLPPGLAPDATGQVDIEIEKVSPARLVLRASGLAGDAPNSGASL